MTPPSSSSKRPTIYELCKEKIKLKNQFQNSQTHRNSHDLRLSMHENWSSSNGNSNMVEVCQQYVKNQLEKADEIKGEFQSASISNNSEFCDENIKSFLDRVSIIGQLLSEEKTYSKFNKSTQSNSWSQYQKLKMKLVLCSICYAQFKNEAELVKHVKYRHVRKRGRPAIPVVCNLCQKKFTCKKDYAIHIRMHSDKTYTCLSCKRMHSLNVSHACKDNRCEKPKRSVWDACKELLTEKSFQLVSSGNSEVVPKLPISKKGIFFNGPLNKVELKTCTSPANKMVSKFTPFLKKSKINHDSLNSINCGQSSIEQLLGKFKGLENLQSSNLTYFKAETMNSSQTDDTKFFCSICNVSFTDMVKYEAHYSIHLDEVFCQIREGDEELQVCSICGGCFTETNAFQAHKLTHVDTELSDIK